MQATADKKATQDKQAAGDKQNTPGKPNTLADPGLKDRVSEAEWQLRVDLAAAYRLVAHYGWDDLIFTHLSVRIPGPEHHFLINPFGALFEEITASSLVKIDLNGEKVDESPFWVNPAGFTIHSAIHQAREDAQCVMHTHTTAGVAVSAQREGLLPLSQQSLFPLAGLAYHDYEGIAVRDDEKARLVRDLGAANFMILRNHGLLTCAPTIPDAFLAMFILQRACEIQVAALAGGQPLTAVPQAIVDKIVSEGDKVTSSQGGLLAWPGLLRKLDRIDPCYRD
ncbi:decarboxylase NovR [Microbulbifer aestuariivivens]|uniref:Decarboxylase NovR n=1 Tax=Microbulbifer aestuariivivens TaxID=1908308 RepID=A0ABP9WR74_9GAMM